MSAGYQCEFTDTGPHGAVHLHVNTETGATVALCAEHNAPGLIPILAAELGVDPGEFYAHIERYLARERKKADQALADAQAAVSAKDSQGPAEPGMTLTVASGDETPDTGNALQVQADAEGANP